MEIVTLTFLDTVLLDSPSILIGAMADTFHMTHFQLVWCQRVMTS